MTVPWARIGRDGMPRPEPGTRFRLKGPYMVNGMQVWRVFEAGRDEDRKLGKDFFVRDEAVEFLRDLEAGRASCFMGASRFVMRKI